MIYKEDLDTMQCNAGHEAKGVWIHSSCHTTVPTWVRYEDGVLIIRCATCNKVISEVAVASKIIKRV